MQDSRPILKEWYAFELRSTVRKQVHVGRVVEPDVEPRASGTVDLTNGQVRRRKCCQRRVRSHGRTVRLRDTQSDPEDVIPDELCRKEHGAKCDTETTRANHN